jgi:hypothetical protein
MLMPAPDAANGKEGSTPIPDWLDLYLDWTSGIISPDIFRQWTGIGALAAALERRVWIETSSGPLYPNLFTLLVAPPGVGKTEGIKRAEELLMATKKFKVAPKSVTSASLVDAVNESAQRIPLAGGLVEFASLFLPAGELGVLLPAHDLGFLSILNDLYDNPPNYTEKRRTLDRNTDIVRPQINILGGSQPAYLTSLLPEEAWNMGFTSRMIMVYANAAPKKPLFEFSPGTTVANAARRVTLVKHLSALAGLHGPFTLTQAAMDNVTKWHLAGGPPIPQHSRLAHYNSRRTIHLLKLSMAASASRSLRLEITELDVERAKTWLFASEALMPDIFRDMVGRSDGQVIKELHMYLWAEHVRTKQPLHESLLFDFLSARVPSERVKVIIEVAERSNVLIREANSTNYIPKPIHQHGVI